MYTRSFAHAWNIISILNDKKNAMPTKVTMNRTITMLISASASSSAWGCELRLGYASL